MCEREKKTENEKLKELKAKEQLFSAPFCFMKINFITSFRAAEFEIFKRNELPESRYNVRSFYIIIKLNPAKHKFRLISIRRTRKFFS